MNSGSAGPGFGVPAECGGSPDQLSSSEEGQETPRVIEEDALDGVKSSAGEAVNDESVVNDETALNLAKQQSPLPKVTTSSPVAQQPHKTVSANEDNYFSPRPMHFNTAKLSIPEDEELFVSSRSRLTSTSPSNLTAARAGPKITPEHAMVSADSSERPMVQRDYSSASTISNASTVRAIDNNHFLPLSQSRSRDAGYYPNQAYSALHYQQHPTQFSMHYLRSRSSNPSPYAAYNAYSEDFFLAQSETQQATTEPNSAATSPGLFTARSSPHRTGVAQSEADGTYASPYLHHTHRQVPKETHLAEIDFDPISGRKVINQYEVIDELGRGVHGKVKLGRNLVNDTYVAIKIVERYSKRKRLGKNNSHEAKIKQEIAILKKARHPNIVGLLEVIDDPMSKKVYIILEHVEMGEVQWRVHGATEVCLVEYRRCQREAQGIFDDQTAVREDEHILEEAHKHIERHDLRKWQQLKQQRMQGNDIASWSLEYGDDDDDNVSTSNGNMSRVSSSTGPMSNASRQIYSEQNYPPPDQTVLHYEDTASLNRQRNLSEQHLSSCGDDRRNTGLEGTMYGAYDTSLIRGRTPSVSGSVSSAGFERDLLDQVPENFRYVPLMTIDQARRAFRDTVLGLEYLHYQGVVHRDIKPANLLQSADHHIKISDFGVSYLGKQKNETFPLGDETSEVEGHDVAEAIELAKTVGTPAFYAPELCHTDGNLDAPTPPVTQQIDIWALGVTLYCLVYGRVPFYDENTFALMSQIAKGEAYIPTRRLKAVDTNASSRPSSHGRTWLGQPPANKRLPHELEYEDVDDELRDLLKRMLTKDPQRRITLNEVKHHGFLVRDIKDKVRWLEDTDPNRFTDGRRIEISKEDVDVAVVPLTIAERAKSVARKVGDMFGISSKSRSRKRAESTTTNASDRSYPTSAASSSSTISQDARRQQERRRPSIKPEESIFTALKASKESEHPLSQSVTASPEARDSSDFFPGPDIIPDSPMSTLSGRLIQSSHRPHGPDRVQSSISTTGSIRTIRPGDLGLATGATTLPALPSTPMEMTAPSSLSGIFGGAKQKLLSTVRNARDGSTGRASPTGRTISSNVDPHSQASLAVSEAVAEGHVNSSSYLMEGSTTGSSINSPVSSRAPSVSSHLAPEPMSTPEANLSRKSSLSSIASRSRLRSRTDTAVRPPPLYLPLLGDAASDHKHPMPSAAASRDILDIAFSRAKEEQIRKRIQESDNRPISSQSHARHQSVTSQEACPPSPDDMIFYRKELEQAKEQNESYFGRLDAFPGSSQSNLVSSSSEDHFTRMSQSTSNPSIPSVASANSSVPTDEGMFLAQQAHNERKPSDDMFLSNDQRTIYATSISSHQDDFAYDGDGDHAIESDEDDDDSDDSFVEMTRHRSRIQGLVRSESVSNGELALRRARRATGESHSMKSVRSGSNNTMKKVCSRNDTEDEGEKLRPATAT